MDPQEWLDVFLPFTSVYYLGISTNMAPIVVNALNEFSEDGEVFPNLRLMSFESRNPPSIRKALYDFINDNRRKIDVME